jgi:hypothetical protein
MFNDKLLMINPSNTTNHFSFLANCILLMMLTLFFSVPLFAHQKDSTIKKTITKEKVVFPDSIFKFNTKISIPKRAGLYSAILPGLGQIYNKQYWKTGLVAVAAGTVTYFIIDNRKNYQKYQEAYISRIDNNPATTDTYYQYSINDIDILRRGFRKYYEYSIISGTVCYLINILDAFTSSHLKTFDMSKNISMKATPYFDTRKQVGVKMVVSLK